MVRIAGVKLHNGEPFVDDGSLAELEPAATRMGRGEVPLGGLLPAPFSVRVIPGMYFLGTSGERAAPSPETDARPAAGDLPDQDLADLALDVPSVPQHFRVPPQRRGVPQHRQWSAATSC